MPCIVKWSSRSVTTMDPLEIIFVIPQCMNVEKPHCRSISERRASRPSIVGPPGTHNCHTPSSANMLMILLTSGLAVAPSPHALQNSRTICCSFCGIFGRSFCVFAPWHRAGWFRYPYTTNVPGAYMRAVRFHDYRGLSGIEYEDAPLPVPGDREVLV